MPVVASGQNVLVFDKRVSALSKLPLKWRSWSSVSQRLWKTYPIACQKKVLSWFDVWQVSNAGESFRTLRKTSKGHWTAIHKDHHTQTKKDEDYLHNKERRWAQSGAGQTARHSWKTGGKRRTVKIKQEVEKTTYNVMFVWSLFPGSFERPLINLVQTLDIDPVCYSMFQLWISSRSSVCFKGFNTTQSLSRLSIRKGLQRQGEKMGRKSRYCWENVLFQKITLRGKKKTQDKFL